jgi:hypothetical protein
MKTFLDRLAFFAHRPRFFGKTFTNIVAQGFPFDSKIGKYLNFAGACLGYKTVGGSHITALEPMTEKEARKVDRVLGRHSRRFHESMMRSNLPAPSLVMLIGFRIGRTTLRLELDDRNFDYRYYRDKGLVRLRLLLPRSSGPAEEGGRQPLRCARQEDGEEPHEVRGAPPVETLRERGRALEPRRALQPARRRRRLVTFRSPR